MNGATGRWLAGGVGVLAWAGVLGVGAPLHAQGPGVAPPVRAVALYTSGVGYFQHAGTVSGSTPFTLTFRGGQVNDLLKSLVLEDLGGGQPGEVIYPSRDPLEKALEGLQVDLGGNPSLPQLLNQLRGAEVVVRVQGESLKARLLGVEQREVGRDPRTGETRLDWLVNLSHSDGMRSVGLAAIQEVGLEDPGLRRELERALELLDRERGQELKPVTMRFPGSGERQVRLGYVVEAPVWKSSYRLLLPEDPARGGARIQGWAIVENQTETDWEGVRLSLLSGRPVSFIQDLYSPLYVTRPTVEPPAARAVPPPLHAGGIAPESEPGDGGRMARRLMAKEGAPPMAMPPPAPAAARPAPYGSGAEPGGGGESWETAELDPGTITARAAAEPAGTLYRFQVEGVSLPRHRSMMLPIVADPITARPVSLYNAALLARHPWHSAWLENTSGKFLPAGPVAVYAQGSYGGDARLDDLPPGARRLVSHGVDQEVTVHPPAEERAVQLVTAKVVKGTLLLTRQHRSSYPYVAANVSGQARELLIEHPIRPGWKLAAETPAPVEESATHRRFLVTLPAAGRVTLTVVEEQTREQRVAILDQGSSVLLSHARNGAIPEAVRAVLEKAAAHRQKLEENQRAITRGKERLEELGREQARLRENIQATPEGSRLTQRMLQKLDESETAMEKQQNELEGLQQKQELLLRELEHYLQGLG